MTLYYAYKKIITRLRLQSGNYFAPRRAVYLKKWNPVFQGGVLSIALLLPTS